MLTRFPLVFTLLLATLSAAPAVAELERMYDEFMAENARSTDGRTASAEGQAMYVWLYMDLAAKNCCGPEDTSASWPRLKAAFDDLVARHPDTLNKNYYGTYACRARDRKTTGRLLQELGSAASFWAVSGITAEGCRRFAFTGT